MPERDMPSLSSYSSPNELYEDGALTADQKQEMLIRWKNDLDSRLAAESEGMSKSDPLSQSKEGSLADQLQAVNELLEKVGGDDGLQVYSQLEVPA